MNLKNLTPKDKQLYKIAMERKESFINFLKDEGITINLEEIFNHISRAEYKRGKADGAVDAMDDCGAIHGEDADRFIEKMIRREKDCSQILKKEDKDDI